MNQLQQLIEALPASLSTAILSFARQQQQLNRSAHTVHHMQRDLVQMAHFWQAQQEQPLQWSDIPRAWVQDFIRQRFEANISARTLARQISSLRSFYKFLIEKNPSIQNPTSALKVPKRQQLLPKSLDVDSTDTLLDVPLNTWQDVRDQAIFELLYSAGLRVSECANLDLSPGLDELFSGWVRVLGKGAKERISPVGDKAMQALVAWLKIRAEHANPDEKAVFVNRFGKRLGVRSIQQRLDLRTDKAGLPTKMSPHRLRHACATHVLESSGDLRAVQELLGHANLATTQIYTKLDMQHLTKVFQNAHPRAKKQSS